VGFGSFRQRRFPITNSVHYSTSSVRAILEPVRTYLAATALVGMAVTALLVAARLDWWELRPAPLEREFRFADGFEDGVGSWHGFQREPDSNFVEVTARRPHSGAKSLECRAVPYDGHRSSKADIFLGGLPFVKGDQVWFSGWYYLEGMSGAGLVFLWDLEASRKYQSPGRRLYLQENDVLASDLGKWWRGPTFRQHRGAAICVPRNRWVSLRLHLYLAEGETGRLEVWQDGAKILDGYGQTLPTASAVYDRLQIGITANGNRSHAATLFVDDIVLSNRPIE
jgi:hypothetical protein